MFQEKDYFDYLKNKRVVIVGPSSYLLSQNKGHIIDSFDVVVRINAAFTIGEEYCSDYGYRADVLYSSLNPLVFPTKEDVKLWAEKGLKWIIFKSRTKHKRVKSYVSLVGDIIPWLSAKRTVSMIEEKIKKHPYTGITAIVHILSAEIQSLNIYGFDFHSAVYVPGYSGFNKDKELQKVHNDSFNSQTHDRTSQIKFLKEVWESDDRLKIDQTLKNVFKTEIG